MMEVPENYGGPGLSLLQRAIVIEELSRTIALPARGEGMTGPSVRHILFTLTGELKEKCDCPGSLPGGVAAYHAIRREFIRTCGS